MTIWLTVSIVALLVQLAYWTALSQGFGQTNGPAATLQAHPVSVIVAARDEEESLPSLLTALSNQSSTEFEVLVADDGSTDKTPEILSQYASVFKPGQLRTIRIEHPVQPRKKNALTAAVGEAQFDRLLFTDADCIPGPDWVRNLSARLNDGSPAVVVGYSPFEKATGLLGLLSRYETFVTGFFTAAAIGRGFPYMAVGRNLAYSKEVFDSVGGFEHSRHILSGDDDLFVQEVERTQAAAITHATDPATYVESLAPTTWREWTRQKTRHTSTGMHYDARTKLHLFVFHTSAILLWLLPIAGGPGCLAALAARQVAQWFTLKQGAKALHETELMAYQPILEAGYVLYNLVLAPIGLIAKRRAW